MPEVKSDTTWVMRNQPTNAGEGLKSNLEQNWNNYVFHFKCLLSNTQKGNARATDVKKIFRFRKLCLQAKNLNNITYHEGDLQGGTEGPKSLVSKGQPN